MRVVGCSSGDIGDIDGPTAQELLRHCDADLLAYIEDCTRWAMKRVRVL